MIYEIQTRLESESVKRALTARNFVQDVERLTAAEYINKGEAMTMKKVHQIYK